MEEKRAPRRVAIRCTNQWEKELMKPEPKVPVREDWYMEEDKKEKGIEYLRRKMFTQGWSQRLCYSVAKTVGVSTRTIKNWRDEIIAELRSEKIDNLEQEKELFIEQLTNGISDMQKKAKADPRVWGSWTASMRLKSDLLNIKDNNNDPDKSDRVGEDKQSVAERVLEHLANLKGPKTR